MATKAKCEKRELAPAEREARRQLKAAKFRELAEARVNAAIKRLQSVARLGNRTNYVYSDEQAKTVCQAIERATQDVHSAFSSVTAPKMFTL